MKKLIYFIIGILLLAGFPIPKALAAQTFYLHQATTTVGSTTYRTINALTPSGTLFVHNYDINILGEQTATPTPTVFVSDPLAGSTDVGGVYTFNVYARETGVGAVTYLRSYIYRIDTAGNATQIDTYAQDDANATGSNSYTLMNWTHTLPSTILNTGERLGVELRMNVTVTKNKTGKVGMDINAQNSNVSVPWSFPPGDTTPPVISGVTAASFNDVAAKITWATDENASSQVEYGTTISYGNLEPAAPTNLSINHAVTLTGLSPNTLYHYRVRSKDAAGNEAISGDYTFTTSSTINRTINKVEFFIDQDGAQQASGTNVTMPFSFNIPETAPAVKSAFVVINGVSTGSANLTLDVDIDNKNSASLNLDSSNVPQPFQIRYNAFNTLKEVAFAGTYSYTVNVRATGATVSLYSAKLILTYAFDKTSNQQLKTVQYFVGQDGSIRASGSAVAFPFSVEIFGSSPVVKSAFVETTGVSTGNADLTIDADINGANGISLSLDSNANNATPFKFRYDATASLGNITSAGTYNYTYNLTGTGTSVSLWSAKIIITYQLTVLVGGFLPSGTFESASIDAGGPSTFYTIYWTAVTPAGASVKFQIAANTDNATWNYYGPDGTSGTYYTVSGSTLNAIHNNQRYLRYKATLETTNASITPELQDVTINFSR